MTVRRSKVSDVFAHTLHQPALCLVAQGGKQVFLDESVYEYNPQQFILISVDMPLASRIVQASSQQPYLAMRLDLETALLSELATHVYPDGIPAVTNSHAITLGPMEPALVACATRLLGIIGRPEEERIFGQLHKTELILRLLRGPAGAALAQLGVRDSHMRKVQAAITYIRTHYTQMLDMADVAARTHMSVSSFHLHFKAATSMSPLQYQKVLRLQEARRLLLATDVDVQHAAFAVGYQSVSQFSREYRRKFAKPPTHDAPRLRAATPVRVAGEY